MTNNTKKSAQKWGGVLSKSPFPTQAEIVRDIVNALGTKSSSDAKKLDYYVETGDADHQKYSEILEDFIFEPIKSITCESTAMFLRVEIDRFFKNYLGLVKVIALDRLSRDETLPLIVEHFFSVRAAAFLANFHNFSGGPSPIQFVDSNQTAIETVFQWFNENEKGWDSRCNKEEKDKYADWRKGNHKPSITSFKLLPVCPENKTLLLIASAVDYFRKSELGKSGINFTRQHLFCGFDQYDHGEPLSLAQIEANKKYPLSMEALKNCTDLLLDKSDSSIISKGYAYERIKDLKAALKEEDPNELMSYLISWLEARWHVKAGDLKEAIKFYKLAFEQCLYSAGKGQEMIFKDALKVAAKIRDLAFLKQLKNYGIVFGYFTSPLNEDGLDLSVNNKKNRGSSNIIEDWEIERWRKEFSQAFREHSLFKNINPYKDDAKAGLLLDTLDASKLKANPDQKIKVGSWKKQIPQLVHFTLLNDVNKVRKLLEKGADVDVFSESGETPLLMAIQNMNPFNLDAPLDDSCFKLITSHSHTNDTINRRTTKLKLLPLICAVNTGNINVVNRLLEWGAEVDRRGETDEQTALNICLKRIAMLKNSNYVNIPNTPSVELLEDIRRRSSGIAGNTLDEIKTNFDDSKNNKLYNSFQKSYTRIMKERTASLDIEAFRDIALLLIQNGANSNTEHKSPVKGYTPLMLAAESNEAELFEEMCRYGGKPDKCYKHPQAGQNINCFQIALAFRSHNVSELLKRKYGYHLSRNL